MLQRTWNRRLARGWRSSSTRPRGLGCPGCPGCPALHSPASHRGPGGFPRWRRRRGQRDSRSMRGLGRTSGPLYLIPPTDPPHTPRTISYRSLPCTPLYILYLISHVTLHTLTVPCLLTCGFLALPAWEDVEEGLFWSSISFSTSCLMLHVRLRGSGEPDGGAVSPPAARIPATGSAWSAPCSRESVGVTAENVLSKKRGVFSWSSSSTAL